MRGFFRVEKGTVWTQFHNEVRAKTPTGNNECTVTQLVKEARSETLTVTSTELSIYIRSIASGERILARYDIIAFFQICERE